MNQNHPNKEWQQFQNKILKDLGVPKREVQAALSQYVEFVEKKAAIPKAKKKLARKYLKTVYSKLYSRTNRKLLKSYFKRVKKTYIKKIKNSKKLPKEDRKFLLRRAKKSKLLIKFKHFDRKSHPRDDDPRITHLILSNKKIGNGITADYDIVLNPFTVFQIQNANPYSFMQFLAHEMAHTIDACLGDDFGDKQIANKEIYAAPLRIKGYQKLLGCIGEKQMDEEITSRTLYYATPEQIRFGCEIMAEGDAAKLESCIAKTQKTNHGLGYCGKTPLAGNHMSEAFADFMAAEIVGAIIERDKKKHKLKSSMRDLLLSYSGTYVGSKGECNYLYGSSQHPSNEVRFDWIQFQSKTFLEQSGCAKYRSVDSTCESVF